MPGILFIRTSPLSSPTILVFGILIGALNFRATEGFRRRAGVSPWRIHPVIWALASLFVTVFITVLAAIAIRTTKAPGGSRLTTMRDVDYRPRPTGTGRVTGAPMAPFAPPVTGLVEHEQPTMAVSPPSWHPDPSGVHQYRYWDGSEWTEHVATGGTVDIDPPPRA